MSAGTTLTVQAGADFWVQFAYADASAIPRALSNPKMEIRTAADSAAMVLFTSEGASPTIALTFPSTGVVVASIAGSVTKNILNARVGAWDFFATDVSANAVCQLVSGNAIILPNVTVL